MKINPNDPTITAYILGELDEAERREIENVLTEDPESRKYVEELRETTEALSVEFARDPELALSSSHRQAIEEELSGSRKSATAPVDGQIRGGFFSGLFGWRFGVAFSVAMVALIASVAYFNPSFHTASRTVQFAGRFEAPEPADRPQEELATLFERGASDPGAPAPARVGDQVQPQPASVVEGLEKEGLRESPNSPPLPEVQLQQKREYSVMSNEAEAVLADTRNPEARSEIAAKVVHIDEYVTADLDRNSETSQRPALGREAQDEASQREGSPPLALIGQRTKELNAPVYFGVDPALGDQLQQANQSGPQSNGAYFFYNKILSERERPLMVTKSGGLVLDSAPNQAVGGMGGLGGGLGRYGFYGDGNALGSELMERELATLSYPGTEDYESFQENPFKSPLQEPLSTLSIDVDTASYSNVRRFLNQGQLPPKDSIRIEEMINYFDYDYPQPTGEEPFSVQIEVSQCPWKPEHQLARLGIQGKEVAMDDRGTANLVFLLDVSGSMEPANKLPLVKQGMKLLLNQLRASDRVAIVTYAGSSGIALPSTPCSDKPTVVNAIEALRSGGSTNGASGIELAYKTARQNFSDGGINRVILATDGDFNVGITDRNALVELIEREAKSGVFLSVLGFGMGNLKDHKLESLADKGNGHYAYIDTLQEAQKVLVDQLGGTLFTIAKDVKIQIEFNPGQVGAYRLIGYENRKLAAQDFNDDTKDAGEVGAGHSVTALYEIVPPGVPISVTGVDPLKYQGARFDTEQWAWKIPYGPDKGKVVRAERPDDATESDAFESDEMMTVKLRYKQPDGDTSKKVEIPVKAGEIETEGSLDHTFAAAVAEFGMILRGSTYKGNANLDQVLDLARQGKGADEDGYRAEFLQLVKLAQSLAE